MTNDWRMTDHCSLAVGYYLLLTVFTKIKARSSKLLILTQQLHKPHYQSHEEQQQIS
jgi:hypothetical protein